MSRPALPLVSIAIPTYNRADSFLKEALESAVNQTYPNIEILVSDNCSEDETERVVEGFQDSRIRYFRQPQNIGSNKNCNFCLEHARGKYIVFLFDDDLLDTDFVETCINALPGHEIGVVLTGAREIDKDGRILGECRNQATGRTAEEFFLEWFANKVPLYYCSTLYYTQGLREIGGLHSPHNQYEDVVATAKMMAKYQMVYVADVKASFRVHSRNLGLAVDIRAWCEDSLYLIKVLTSLCLPKSSLVAEKALPYFCKVNFRRAARIGSWSKRAKAYWTVSKCFNHSYPLPHFFYNKNIQPRLKALSRKFHQIFPLTWKTIG